VIINEKNFRQRQRSETEDLDCPLHQFNFVGMIVFLWATAVYSIAFSILGFWMGLVANSIGAVLQLLLIAWLN
jgi:hypothetical protein